MQELGKNKEKLGLFLKIKEIILKRMRGTEIENGKFEKA